MELTAAAFVDGDYWLREEMTWAFDWLLFIGKDAGPTEVDS